MIYVVFIYNPYMVLYTLVFIYKETLPGLLKEKVKNN
jgi:hypothetical protein